MQVRVFAPSARLAPFVRAFEIVAADAEVTRTLLPDPGVIAGFRYGGAAAQLDAGAPRRIPDRVLTGLRARARTMRTAPGGRIVLAKFRAGGAAPFFRAPLHALFDATVPLDELLPRAAVAETAGRIAEARDDRARVAALEAFLGSLAPPAPDPLAVAAARAIDARRGALRIDALARDLGVSQDALEKRFRRAVGASPKRYASIVQLHGAVEAYRPGANLARLAAEAGYYDQAHFHRALRAATGRAPGALLRSSDYC